MNNQMFGGLSQETLTTALRAMTHGLETLANGSAIERYKSAVSEIQGLLKSPAEAAPEWAEVLLPLEIVREALTSSDSAERLANMDAGNTLRRTIASLKSIRDSQHQGAPAKLYFPTMLRKMWSGGEVSQWIAEQGPLYRKPLVTHGDTATLQQVYELLGIGEFARTPGVLMVCLENMQRFCEYLGAVEREFFMVPGEPGDEPGDEGLEPADECLLNKFGAESAQHYVEQFRTALLMISKPAGEPIGYIQFGEADSGEIGDYEIEPNRKACEALNIADNGNGTIYDLYMYPSQEAGQQ